MCFFL